MAFSVTDGVSAILSTALNGLTARQNVIADNIANIDTPNFRAFTVEFEDALKQAINDGKFPRDLTTAESPEVTLTALPTSTPVGANGNNVDLRQEEMSLIQSQYSFQILGRALSDHYALIKTATTMA